jgi:hypothetical protein
VLRLAQQLRRDGVDAELDQFHDHQPQALGAAQPLPPLAEIAVKTDFMAVIDNIYRSVLDHEEKSEHRHALLSSGLSALLLLVPVGLWISFLGLPSKSSKP